MCGRRSVSFLTPLPNTDPRWSADIRLAPGLISPVRGHGPFSSAASSLLLLLVCCGEVVDNRYILIYIYVIHYIYNIYIIIAKFRGCVLLLLGKKMCDDDMMRD